jgi:hypothetical protein
MVKKTCEWCGKRFDFKVIWQKFCSNSCKQKNKRKKAGK